jgi:hypothetical protein
MKKLQGKNPIAEVIKMEFNETKDRFLFLLESKLGDVKPLLTEQRISDLPQNQQSATTKPNLTSTKPQDLRSTLSPQQQQQVKDMTRGQKDLSKDYYSNQSTNKSGNYKVDDHTFNAILSIATAFIPVVGPFISAGIALYDAGKYYEEGDTKTAGMMAMFALLPGAGAIASKVPGVKQLGANGMETLATKLSTKAPLSKLESEVAAGLSANKSLVQQELSQITKNVANNATKATTDVVKQKLTKIGKTGLEFTATAAGYVAAGKAYGKTYDVVQKDTPKSMAQTEGFEWESIKNIFGSSGNEEDNIKLQSAWKEGWRPGSVVPEKYQTQKYKQNYEQEEKNIEELGNFLASLDLN